ncbi:MAG TPA: leucine--tRNA ligase [Bacillota bacterium]|nr:leucine--tRNA ligase [Bacillota bacterium]HPJ85749.1 leucine--tRNA ligase [Bacillota bacterium]
MSEFIPSFNHTEIEKKWQDRWYASDLFHAVDFDKRPKYYALVEFPYPSGIGMHVGHFRAYMSLETIVRKRRMEGYNVLFPIGFDAFGLPTENYAIQNNIHPRIVTDQNIKTFTKQLREAGFSFDLDRIVDTTDPEYYKFTQWIFLKMYEHGLVYRSKTYVNFCPDCKVVLSNEESQGGTCDRCGTEVVQKEKEVWFLKITAYAEKLLEGLKILESPERIKTEQEKWIGRSDGAFISFPIADSADSLEVFTTRPDTIYGVTFMVIAPEHPAIKKYEDRIKNMDAIKDYAENSKRKSEFERVQLVKDKTGLKIVGLEAVNPITKEKIPVFIADYVMMTYGTGAIMAVPGHDQRDYEFATKYSQKIVEVIKGGDLSKEAYTDIEDGVLVNSGILDGLKVKEAIAKMIAYLGELGCGKKGVQFKMKDWAFNRQRYWGEPIPLVYCDDCGIVPVPYEDLPVTLPMVDSFIPTDTGESPLANIKEFVECTCPKCGKTARRETDTMPQWAGSSWYFLRYIDPHDKTVFASRDKLDYWGQVDWYNGGMEHVTRHLIYSRFWNLFLNDIDEVPFAEPYCKRTAQGLILGSDGEKMSKSKGNSVNPQDIINEYGADTLRTYILFIGDYELPTPWNDNGIKGCRRFLDKIWRAFPKVNSVPGFSIESEILMNQTIKGVSDDYESMKYNTAIAKMMTLMNELGQKEEITRGEYETLLKLLYPVAPHITEELFEKLGKGHWLDKESWPAWNEEKLAEDKIEIVVSVNGKVRDKLTVPVGTGRDKLEKLALELPKIREITKDNQVRKVIVVEGKLVNLVI